MALSSEVSLFLSPQRVHKPIRRLLDQAKENIDVIDFRKPRHHRHDDYDDHVRRTRQPDDGHEDFIKGPGFSAPSEPVPTFLPFPGTEPNRRSIAGERVSEFKQGARCRQEDAYLPRQDGTAILGGIQPIFR